MVSETVTITNDTGLHARPAGALVSYVKQYSNNIYLRKGEKQIDASSVLKVMMLGATKGTEIEVIVEGENEKDVLKSVVTFIGQLKG